MATMKLTTFISLLLLLLLLLLFSPATASCVARTSPYAVSLPNPQPKEPITISNPHCKKVDYPPLCQAAVDKYLPENSGDAPVDVLKANLNATIDKLHATIAAAKKLVEESEIEHALKLLLNGTSISQYETMIDDYQTAFEGLMKGDLGTVWSNVDSGLTDINTCIDSFIDPMLTVAVRVSPLVAEDEELRQMATNAIAFKEEMKDINA